MDSVKTKRSRATRRDERRAQNAPALRHVPAEAISAPAAVVGWLLRTALLFFGGYAFSIFLGDAAGLLILQGRVRDEIVAAVPDVAWTALAAAVLCSLTIFNRITAVAVPLAAAGGAAVFLLTRSVNVFTFAENVVRCTVNTVLMNLAETGYTVMAGYVGDTTYAFPPRLLVTWGLCTVTAVNGTESTDDDKSATCAVTVSAPANGNDNSSDSYSGSGSTDGNCTLLV